MTFDFLNILKSFMLGIIQGLSEPIPVSSSAQVLFYNNFLQYTPNGLTNSQYLNIINFGSSLAILYLLLPLIKNLLKNTKLFLQTKNQKYYGDFKLFQNTIVMCLPLLILGLPLKKIVNPLLNANNFWTIFYVPATGLLITAIFNMISNIQKETKLIKNFTILNSFMTGLMQIFAIIPGVSRSGSTFLGTRIQGLQIKSSIELIFLAYLPVSFGLFIIDFIQDYKIFFNGLTKFENLVGIIGAFLATYFSFNLFISFFYKKRKLNLLSYYCFVVACGYYILGLISH